MKGCISTGTKSCWAGKLCLLHIHSVGHDCVDGGNGSCRDDDSGNCGDDDSVSCADGSGTGSSIDDSDSCIDVSSSSCNNDGNGGSCIDGSGNCDDDDDVSGIIGEESMMVKMMEMVVVRLWPWSDHMMMD